ncbi:YxeA family protein [Levilactobacillus lindianensis]|uniref:YxeA family protein n=1 Tax=Levilactobacillus lindianensis TaxID=2486018 RepID=UPI000F744A77|nr:YxeA family protein [Levilactobacillus lindianensis]
MKILKALLTISGTLLILLAIGAIFAPAMTRNRGSEVAMAHDNVNPWVKNETVYADTTSQPIKHFIGGGGEDEYTYVLQTYNEQGKSRKLTFDVQWKLKPHHFLKIETKGQNVETWKAVARETVPSGARQNLMMS